MKYFFGKNSVFLFLFIIGCNFTFSQTSKSYFYENEVDFNLPLGEKWAMEMGIGNRRMLWESFIGEKISNYQHEHLEIGNFTNYKSTDILVISLGLRYRFKELFDSTEINEFRIIEQIKFEPNNSPLKLSHRIRLEQRFREHTVHRLRYEAEISELLNEHFSVGTGTEALYAVSTELQPEAEQRFSIGLENTSFSNLELGIDFQYRLENYTRRPEHEFFIISGVSLDL